MSESAMVNTLKTAISLITGLEKGYKFIQEDVKELNTVNEIIQADNAYLEIYVYKPDGTLAYIQNKGGWNE